MLPYKSILYKISGEALMGGKAFGQDFETMCKIAKDIKKVQEIGIKICLVVGGGNICRGITMSTYGMERATGDYIGMLGTVMNAMAMQNVMESHFGMQTRVLSALPIKSLCEPYIRRRALRHLEKNRVVIFAAGIGSPYFSTDTAATLRAVEMNCDAVCKGTGVDGVYSEDPKNNPNATRYEKIGYAEVLSKNLKFMDASAISLARDNKMPVLLFSIKDTSTPLLNVLKGKQKYTLINE